MVRALRLKGPEEELFLMAINRIHIMHHEIREEKLREEIERQRERAFRG